MSKSSTIALFLAIAACGPLPPDYTPIAISTGDTGDLTTSEGFGGSTTGAASESSGEVESTGAMLSTSNASSSGDSSTTDSESTGDDSSDDSTTGESCVEPTCLGAACAEGEACRPHPFTDEWSCVAPCIPGVGCQVEQCGELVTGLCDTDPNGAAWCFPMSAM
jgi:hypothetical protein